MFSQLLVLHKRNMYCNFVILYDTIASENIPSTYLHTLYSPIQTLLEIGCDYIIKNHIIIKWLLTCRMYEINVILRLHWTFDGSFSVLCPLYYFWNYKNKMTTSQTNLYCDNSLYLVHCFYHRRPRKLSIGNNNKIWISE